MKNKIAMTISLLLLAGTVQIAAEEAAPGGPVQTPQPSPADMAMNRHLLSEFGPYKTIKEAKETLAAATKALIEKGGGVIVIPPDAPQGFFPRNPVQEAYNKPTVTIIDMRGGVERKYVPPLGASASSLSGGCSIIERDVYGNLPWQGCYATQDIVTRILGGSSSYMATTSRPVAKGKDVRVHVMTSRGLFAGQNLRITGEKMGYSGKGEWVVVKSLGIDGGSPYFVADLTEDHPEGAIVYNKNVVNGMTVQDVAHSDNQSMSMMVSKDIYGVGDTFVYSASLNYQGNVMSGAGDEGGVCYAADIVQNPAVFSGKVESWDAATQTLIFKSGAANPEKLGTSRPIINMNQKKWISSGKVMVIGPGHPYLRTKDVPMHVPLVVGNKDVGWDESIIGRFIAIDDPTEYYEADETFSSGYAGAPGQRSYRWFLIRGLEKRDDGLSNLFVEDTRWWTTDRGGIMLLRQDNDTTSEKNTHELKYIIAPGAWTSDVRQGVCGNTANGNWGVATAGDARKIVLAPFPQMGSKFDFEPDDPITQPLGPVPWLPTGFRVRHHQGFPSRGLSGASFESCNWGKVMVGAGLSLAGPGGKLEDVLKGQKDGNPSYGDGILVHAATGNAFHVRGPVKDSAICLEQWDDNVKSIYWISKGGTSRFWARPANRDFVFEGGNLDFSNHTSVQQRGISQTATPAKNLRGINVPVAADSKELKISFEVPEADGKYAVMASCSWITLHAVKDKAEKGFTVLFETPAPQGATIDWLIVR